jgi:hypothetical protein
MPRLLIGREFQAASLLSSAIHRKTPANTLFGLAPLSKENLFPSYIKRSHQGIVGLITAKVAGKYKVS